METKTIKGKIKTLVVNNLAYEEKDAQGNRRISGYANTPTRDRVNEIVKVEAFRDTMDAFMKNPIMLYMHDAECPIGIWDQYELRAEGLWVSGVIASGTTDSDEAWTLVKQKVLRALSIGFRELEGEWNDQAEAYYITKLELLEISVVSVPANAEALFTVTKQGTIMGVRILEDGEPPEQKPVQENTKEQEVESEMADLEVTLNFSNLDIFPEVIKEILAQVEAVNAKIDNEEMSKEIKDLTETQKELTGKVDDLSKTLVKLVKWEADKLATKAGI